MSAWNDPPWGEDHEPPLRRLTVVRLNECDVQVGGEVYCTGQFDDPIGAYRLEAESIMALVEFLESER